MIALKILLAIACVPILVFFGFCLGVAREDIDWETNEMNGWLIKPIKHSMCGAFYGHEYKQSDPPAGGWVGVRCQRCGKYKVRKETVKCE